MSQNPFQSPSAAGTVFGVNDGSLETLRKVATYQRGVLLCILIQLLTIPVNLVMQRSVPELAGLVALVAVLAGLVGTVFVFLLAKNVYSTAVAVLLTILALIPCVGLIILLIVNGKATAIMRKNGIKVGLLGADRSQI